MTAIPVNPKVLTWARAERGLDTVAAAELLGMSPDELAALEDGDATPTVTTLRHMAGKYDMSFTALLMPEPLPPTTRLKVTDFRTHGGVDPVWGPELLAALDEINLLVDGLAELRDADPHTFRPVDLPRATSAMDPALMAAAERARFRLSLEAQLGLNTDAETFRRFRSLVEEHGVFVYVIKAGTTDDWRGLAIYDERQVPVIIINGDEPENGWRLFTLFHEYYHLLLRQTGISNQKSGGQPIEAKCNRFAAHFLMPAEPFVAEARLVNPGHRPWDLRDVKVLASRFHLSITAVAIHLEEVGLAETGFGNAIYKQLQKPARKKGGMVSYYEQMVNKFGGRHFDVVFRALDAGVVNRFEVFELTGVQPEYLPRMRSAVAERRAAYGWPS